MTVIRGPHPFEIFNFGLGVVGGAVGGAVEAAGVVGGAIGWPSCFLYFILCHKSESFQHK